MGSFRQACFMVLFTLKPDITNEQELQEIILLFFFGSAVAYMVASGLFRSFKRRFALSVVMVQAITIISSMAVLFLILLVPHQMLET
jgi:hypothetical protein